MIESQRKKKDKTNYTCIYVLQITMQVMGEGDHEKKRKLYKKTH